MYVDEQRKWLRGTQAYRFVHVADAGIANYQKAGALKGSQDAKDEE
jgi:hypothetical protein